jgi:UTP-glucose-1-phosphate uridylyltransferase
MACTLVVLAAGIGARYGGLKQMEPVGPSGELLLDYAVFDALRAGFGRFVFVIRREIEEDFESVVMRRLGGHARMETVLQSIDAVPAGRSVPPDRRKPWGTGHAVLAAAGRVDGPFAVVNADDYYGPHTYAALSAFLLATGADPYAYAMVGYVLARTLSPHGAVARGICRTDGNGRLTEVVETTGLSADALVAHGLTGAEPVSMNAWAFKPSLWPCLEREFARFLDRPKDPNSDEFYLPDVVNGLVRSGEAVVRVLRTPDAWMGVTNPHDRDRVVRGVAALVEAGVYPRALWG